MLINYKTILTVTGTLLLVMVQLVSPQGMEMDMEKNMTDHHESSLSIGSLNGSGTSWLPESSPMYALHAAAENWTGMNHGSAFLRFTDQNANNNDKRGENAVDAPNWIMTMWDRDRDSKNQLRFRGMLSLDPLTEGNDGYPLLFQTGETWENKPLVDRQHPHDFFMELSATWFYKLTQETALLAYLGLPGEPALGPTAFMHRPSADMNPDAPLSHHWQDATHITFGVFTAGFISRQFKFDASIFTGREPDEKRWNFDRLRFDSYSGRFSYKLLPGMETQVSAAFLKSPEALHPETDKVRLSGSLETSAPISHNNTISTSFIYGGNLEREEGTSQLTNAVLLESELALNRWVPYARYEFIQKTGRDLGLASLEEETFSINAFTLGSAIRLIDFWSLALFAGAQGTVNVPDQGLQTDYGKLPLSYELYIRLRPVKMNMSEMKPMPHKNHTSVFPGKQNYSGKGCSSTPFSSRSSD